MNKKLFLLMVCVLLSSCRGDDQNNVDSFPVTPNPDAFAQFLNTAPGVPAGGVADGEIHNVDDFPEAYYNTIDPTQTRDTFEKWRIANGFLNNDGSPAACELPDCVSTNARFRDTKDLGYGRNMFLRWDKATGDVAVYVENFQVDAIPGVPYGPLNYEALVNGDREWNFGVNAIEFSAYPQTAGSPKFTKFYNFAGDGKRALLASGSQQHFVDLDGRGVKAMPTPCIVCHGGHGRTLVVEDSSGRKVLAPTLPGGVAGDVQANMQTIELDTLQFANEPGFSRADNEDRIRLINEAILSTYQHRKDTIAQAGEWNPDFAIEILNGRYNGNPSNPGAGYNTGFIPSGWRTNPNAESIYNALVGPNCMVCHALRGSGLNPSISFSDFTDFVDDYSDQVDHLTFERGLMPLGLLNYADFWESGNKNPALLAAAISHPERIRDDNTAIPPGAPVAKIVAPLMARGTDPVDGSVLDIPLSAGGSAFAAAGSYRWSVEPSDPADQADIVVNDATLGTATLRAQSPGDYTVNLTISGSEGGGTSSASQVVLVRDTFDSTPLPASSDIQFYDTDGTGISTLLEANCVSCHSDGAGYPGIPVYYVPCNGEGLAGGVAQGYEFLYRSVLARVNFAAPLDSLILRKPTNGATDLNQRGAAASSRYHAGGLALNSEQEIGRMISWILNGAPRGDLPTSIDAADDWPSCL